MSDQTSRLTELLNDQNVAYEATDSTRGTLFIIALEDRSRRFIESWDEGGFSIWGGAITPEQAIAVTLGDEMCGRNEVARNPGIASPDKVQEAYDAGFANGVKATLQQLDGLISSGYDLKNVVAWIDRQWEEGSA